MRFGIDNSDENFQLRRTGDCIKDDASSLKLPKIVHYAVMMRHLTRCIAGAEQPLIGPPQGVTVMHTIEAIYKNAASGGSETLSLSKPTSPNE